MGLSVNWMVCITENIDIRKPVVLIGLIISKERQRAMSNINYSGYVE